MEKKRIAQNFPSMLHVAIIFIILQSSSLRIQFFYFLGTMCLDFVYAQLFSQIDEQVTHKTRNEETDERRKKK